MYRFYLLFILLITSCTIQEWQLQQRLPQVKKWYNVQDYKYIGLDKDGNLIGVVDAATPGIYFIDSLGCH